MADRDAAEMNPFEAWLDSSKGLLDSEVMTDSLKEKCEALFAAWSRFATTYAQAAGAAPARGAAAVPGGPFDPVGWMDAASAGGWGDLWRWFGAGRDAGDAADPWRAERDAFLASREWIAYAAALERYRAALSAGWLKAFRRFVAELAQDGRPGNGMPSWEEIHAHWQEAADAELAAVQRSEEFVAAQRALIRARLDCSARLRERVERFAGLIGLPTRAELDSLHESVHELRRELRALRARIDSGARPAARRSRRKSGRDE